MDILQLLKSVNFFSQITTKCEAVGILCYGRRLDCISSCSKEGAKIAEANIEFLKALGETFHGLPWWKLWKTDSYKRLESSQDFMMK